MEDTRRWSVTYTKQVKQKRKVYQDGFLEHQSFRHKVLLYDEWDKLLDSRFVKKDDVINSGETLTLNSYLVDVGELCGGHKLTFTVNSQEEKGKVSEISGALYSYGSQSKSKPVDRKPLFGKSKGRPINLSPSGKLIRDFKKSEKNKRASSNYMEWQVLYTTQVTQKAKKFHDGFLQLVVRGSQGRQVKLYDTKMSQLDSKFLKKDEVVRSGESLAFESHLVEIGEQEGDRQPITDSCHQGENYKVVGKVDMVNHLVKIPTNKKIPAENTSPGKFTILSESSFKIENSKFSWRNLENEPRRAVHDILSILKQPIVRKVTNKSLMDDCFELHSSDVHSDVKDCVKGCAGECSGSAQEELREKASDHDKVLKSQPVKVLVAAEKCIFSGNEKGSQARSSSSCIRLEPANCTAPAPIPNAECTSDDNPSLEPHTPATASLNSEGQSPTASATLTRSNEIGGAANPPDICACEEIMTGTKSAATLTSGTLPKIREDKGSSSSVGAAASNDLTSQGGGKTLELNVYSKKMDEFPSFDLGI